MQKKTCFIRTLPRHFCCLNKPYSSKNTTLQLQSSIHTFYKIMQCLLSSTIYFYKELFDCDIYYNALLSNNIISQYIFPSQIFLDSFSLLCHLFLCHSNNLPIDIPTYFLSLLTYIFESKGRLISEQLCLPLTAQKLKA